MTTPVSQQPLTAVGHAPPSAAEEPTPQLVRETLTDLGRLAKLEVSLARRELLAELGEVRRAAVAGVLALGLLEMGITFLVVGLLLLSADPTRALLWAAALTGLFAMAAGLWARSHIPQAILAGTRKRLEDDLQALEGHTR